MAPSRLGYLVLALARHRYLEREEPPGGGFVAHGFALDDRLADSQLAAQPRGELGEHVADVLEPAAERPHAIAIAVQLEPEAVVLGLRVARSQALGYSRR